MSDARPALRIAFASSAGVRGREDDADTAARLGADICVWNDPLVDWEAYDRVIIRSAWDYTFQLDAFLDWCRHIGPERLRNAPEIVAFNADKRYLSALGQPTVPTQFCAPGDPLPRLDGEVVIKPNVSAGARDTGRFAPHDHDAAHALIGRIHAGGKTALIQPYLPLIERHGETAIVYLGGALSHVLAKAPILRGPGVAPLAAGDAAPAAIMLDPDLVQPGSASSAELALAERIHAEIQARFGTPLYARIDLVPGPDGLPVLMELELIEPRLYLLSAPGASERFAAAIRAC